MWIKFVLITTDQWLLYLLDRTWSYPLLEWTDPKISACDFRSRFSFEKGASAFQPPYRVHEVSSCVWIMNSEFQMDFWPQLEGSLEGSRTNTDASLQGLTVRRKRVKKTTKGQRVHKCEHPDCNKVSLKPLNAWIYVYHLTGFHNGWAPSTAWTDSYKYDYLPLWLWRMYDEIQTGCFPNEASAPAVSDHNTLQVWGQRLNSRQQASTTREK